MTIKVHSENLILINNLTKTSDRLATAMGRLSTGYRINSASDGAAELILSKGLEKQISGLSVCNDNANMAKSLLTVADGSLSEITSMAQRIRDIALSSANGIYSEDERRAYQSEVDALVEEIKRQTDEARYNDYKLFYGNTSPAIKTNAGASGAGTTGAVGTYKVQKVSKEEAEAQGYTCVSTAQELKDALVAGDANCKVMLMNDINLDDLALDATGSNWTAVGDATTKFQGTLDGNGYTIRNLKINATSNYQGLIGYTSASSTIKNLNIENADIKNTGNYTGTLVGVNSGTIENCSVINSNAEGGGERTGGFVGHNNGTIKNCITEVNVKGWKYTGGFAGGNVNSGSIVSCYSTGNVTSSGDCTGGFVGICNSNTNIQNCYSESKASGATNTGGFAGIVAGSSTINSCYASGSATGIMNVGGFVGQTDGLSEITSCFAKGNTKGTWGETGGFVGYIAYQSLIKSCYATGDVEGGVELTGGFAGYSDSTEAISNCYSTGNVTGAEYTGGFIGGFYETTVDSCYSTGNAIGTEYVGGFVGAIQDGAASNSYCTGTAIGNASTTGGFLGEVYDSVTLSNYAFADNNITSGNGIGTGTAVGADDTAGKDATWFESRNNLAGILGDSFDYSYLNSNLTFQVGVNAGSLNTLDINLSFGVDNLRIDVMSGDSSRESISAIDELIEYTTQVQGRIGSSMNALDSVLGNNTQTQINLVDSNSRLIDADIARESAEVVKTQIRQNMTASLLAQTGTNMSQIVLALYGL